jgi:type II secretory ATPase GspE/PulE/Tfp pilus assembly ATPase PilB-like protein
MAKITPFIKKTPKKDELSEAPQVEELLKNLEFHKAIQNLSNRILAAETIPEIVVSLGNDIRKLFNIHILTIYLIDKTTKEIYTMQASGNEIKEIRFPINFSTFAGFVVQKKKPLHVSDPYNERDLKKIHDQLIFDRSLDKKTGVLTGQIIAIPISLEGIVSGVLEIMNKKGGEKIEEYHQIYLDEIAGVLAKAFDNHLNFFQEKQIIKTRFEALLKEGFLNDIQLEKALRTSRQKSEPLDEIFMRQYGIPKEEIGRALVDYYHCHFIPYDDDRLVPEALLIGLDKTSLEIMRWVPIDMVNGKIRVIMDDPSDMIRRKKIEEMLNTNSISYDVSLKSDILKYLDHFYDSEEQSLRVEEFADDPVESSLPDISIKEENAHPKAKAVEVVKLKKPVFIPDEEETVTARIPAEEKPEPPDEPPAVLSSPHKKANDDVRTRAEEIPLEAHPEEPVVTIFDQGSPHLAGQVINEAYGLRASDIHFEPDVEARNVTLRIRVDGQCIVQQTMTQNDYDTVIAQIKTLGNLPIQTKTPLQSARIRLVRPTGGDLDMRVVIIETQSGQEDTVIHFLPKIKKMPLELIGLSEKSYTTLTRILEQPRGMVLAAGPTGSGITTTLHACVSQINRPVKKIWTVEQPVEITQNGLRQVQVQPQKGFTFPKVLRSCLDADPDVIMVSHLGDSETAKLCMEASMTRNLVLSALPTESIPEGIERLLDMGIPHLSLADGCLAIISQRLIRTLCPKCKEKYHPSREEYDELADLYGKESFEKLSIPYTDDFKLYRPCGCDECGKTGYSGRTGIHEIFVFSRDIKRMIRRREDADAVYAAALSEGMITLLQDWICKAMEGLTDSTRLKQVLIV